MNPWASAWVGETTVEKLSTPFDPAMHVTISNMTTAANRLGDEVTIFFLCSMEGEEIYWATQPGTTDPKTSFDNHLRVNNPQPEEALLSHTGHDGKRRHLTTDIFIKRIKAAAHAAGIDVLPGHDIGITLEYLLRGLTFEVVKAKGRWNSESFLLYLRRHSEILASYMQNPEALKRFLPYTVIPPVPPVR